MIKITGKPNAFLHSGRKEVLRQEKIFEASVYSTISIRTGIIKNRSKEINTLRLLTPLLNVFHIIRV